MTLTLPFTSFVSFPSLNRSQFRAEMVAQNISILESDHEFDLESRVRGRDVLLGVPDDRGVALNHGFIGASGGPEAFRHSFYRLYDTRTQQGTWLGQGFFDCGDLVLQPSIAETHAALAEVISRLLSYNARRVYVIGGGHDFSFGSYLGHARACRGILPIINFDAHFDLRTVEHGQINSGTPFRRVIENLDERIVGGRALLEIGIQRERNPQSLWDYAQTRGVAVAEFTAGQQPWIFHGMSESHDCALSEQMNHWLDNWLKNSASSHHVHLSIDLDVFSTAAASGTSASTSFGVPVETLWPCMEDVLSRKLCRVVDVAELCPARDVQSQTARLAAAVVFRGSLSRDRCER